MNPQTLAKFVAVAMLGWAAALAQAAVTAEEAAKLKSELTPFGAERAGNKDGTIPAWTGGLSSPREITGRRPDPFAAEKPLFTITAKNAEQYADRLTDGTKALLKKYPESFRVDVYKTHRTAAAPQWVYDNTFRSATQVTLVDGPAGPMPKGAYGGIPFPIPKNGAEVMWNHTLRWRGESVMLGWKNYMLTTDGRWVLTAESANEQAMPYYYKESNPANFTGEYWMGRAVYAGPPIRAGEGFMWRQNVDESKSQVWVYLTGQRRVRKVPNACCDTPTPWSAGLMTFDEVDVFSTRMDRFDWKLVGKQEMFIPYNANRAQVAKGGDAEVLGTNRHLNPDTVRWELHRVWVVEAALKPGQRHTAPRSRYYLDEDTWAAVLGDRWDANGQLARTTFTLQVAMPDIPATANVTFGVYDLISGAGVVAGLESDRKDSYRAVSRRADAVFSPDSMAADGVR